jgi:hypothetical protein
MNQNLKGRRFADVAEIQPESLATLDMLPLKILDNVSSSGGRSWDRYIQLQRECFEGNYCIKLLVQF